MQNNQIDNFITNIIQNKLTYLSYPALINIKNNLLKTYNINGIVIEAGCALGGSSICIANYRNQEKIFNIYDVFGQIPPPSEKDNSDVHERYNIIKNHQSTGIRGDTYYGYIDNLLNCVKQNFIKFDINMNNINFIEGLYEDTLQINEPVSFAHIDCDWYNSVQICLQQIIPKLSLNGIVTIDDYNDWSGCRNAVNDYFQNIQQYFTFEIIAGKLNIIKNIEY